MIVAIANESGSMPSVEVAIDLRVFVVKVVSSHLVTVGMSDFRYKFSSIKLLKLK